MSLVSILRVILPCFQYSGMSTVRLEGNEAVLRRLIKVFGIATAYSKTSRAVRREIKIARMKRALCKLVAGGLHCDVDGVYSTMNVGSVIVSVSLSVPRDATSDSTLSDCQIELLTVHLHEVLEV